MSTDMQDSRHERDRSKQETADDLGAHHRAAKPNDGPCFSLALGVFLAQKNVRVGLRICDFDCHADTHFRYVRTTSSNCSAASFLRAPGCFSSSTRSERT